MTLKTLTFATALTAVSATVGWADKITVFDWSGYDDPGFFGAYLETHGAAPNFSFFASEEEGFNKLRTGFSADLAHPCLGALPKFKAAGLTQPIDTSRLDNWDKILPALTGLSDFVDADGTVWAVPFDWGNTGIVYRTDRIDATAATVQSFANPEYAGRVSMPDNVYDAYALASLAIGLKTWEDVSMDHVDQMSEFLRSVHGNVRFYWADQGQLDSAIKTGEIDLAFAWNATELALQADSIPVTMVRDAEIGVSSWACGYVHLKDGSGNDDAVYDYLNAITDVATGQYIVESWGYAHANADTYAAVPQETLASYGYDDVENFLEDSLFTVSLPQDISAAMVKEFERIKAGF